MIRGRLQGGLLHEEIHSCTLDSDFDEHRAIAEVRLSECDQGCGGARLIEQWKKTTKPNILWGYDSPAHPVYLASTLAFLYEETKNMDYAKRAAELLAMYGDLRDVYPEANVKARIEYEDGLPALANFFFMPPRRIASNTPSSFR